LVVVVTVAYGTTQRGDGVESPLGRGKIRFGGGVFQSLGHVGQQGIAVAAAGPLEPMCTSLQFGELTVGQRAAHCVDLVRQPRDKSPEDSRHVKIVGKQRDNVAFTANGV